MLTTVDNPWDPFTRFREWYAFDTEKGYRSCQILDLIAPTSMSNSDADNSVAISNAIDSFVKHDPLHLYKKVTKEVEDVFVA